MIQTDPLTQIKAFAEVHGFNVLHKETRNGDLYTVAKRVGNIYAPRCPYMLPHQLVVWIDGYCTGLNAAAPTRAGE